jgi:hypothetical protein
MVSLWLWIAQFWVSNRIFFARDWRIFEWEVSGTIKKPMVPKKAAMISVI